MIRWIYWDKANFVQATELVNWEIGSKRRYGIGPIDCDGVERGIDDFHRAARQLAALQGADFLIGAFGYADYRMACFLPYDDVMQLPLAGYPALAAWAARMATLPFWADPFEGLGAPELPPAPPRLSYRLQSPME